MIHPVVRLYATAEQAAAAIHDLRQWSFNDEDISLIDPSDATGAGEDPILAAIMAAYVVKSDAKIYAEGVRRGGHLVVVRAPFGTCGIAEGMLDEHGPEASGVVAPQDRATPWDEGAPLSSALQFPTLLQGNSGLSAFLSMPTLLSRARTTGAWLGLPEVSSAASTLSSALGLGLLSGKTAPLSDLFHLPLLAGRQSDR